MKKNLLVILLFLILSLIIFRKIFSGLLPVPSAELVVGYFPWNAGGWPGFKEVIPFKAIVATDVFRQQLPWLRLSLEQVKRGEWPLWNPYNFSGIPHLANPQIHFFYPFNLLFFILPLIPAWVIFVSLVPLLAMIFMYLYTRQLGFSYPARLFSSIAFAFCSIMIFWLEWSFIVHGLVYLPLFLWLIEKIFEKTKWWQFFALVFLIFTEITSGYFPLTVYVFIFSTFYFFYHILQSPSRLKKKILLLTLGASVFGILLSSVQLLPTFQAYQLSAREVEASKKIFGHYLLSPRHLLTIFAHDFFGNFMTRNFWDRDYTEIVGWFGVVALVLAVFGIFTKHKIKKFYLISMILSLLFALKNPIAYLPLYLKIPILSSGLPSRSLFVFEFSMIVLAGMGLETIVKLSNCQIVNFKKIIKILISIGIVYGALWGFVLVGKRFLAGSEWEWRLAVSKRNLILPTFVFLGTGFTIVFLKKFKKLFLFSIFCLALLEYFYFANKFLPFGPKAYIFPKHPLIEFLKEKQALDKRQDFYRHYGIGEAKIDNNFASFFQLFSTEGFDSLYPKRYGEFLASTLESRKPEELMRSDALFPQKDTVYRRKAFNLLGVKYFLNRTDRKPPDEEIDFSEGEFKLVWQQGAIQVFENPRAMPRAFLVGDYQVADSDDQILKIFFAEDFDIRKSVVLEEGLGGFDLGTSDQAFVKILDYKPNKIKIKTETSANQLLFLANTFYPGWQAKIDDKETGILRANYTFQTIKLPKGKHEVVFFYLPESFILGKKISIYTFLLIILLGGWRIILRSNARILRGNILYKNE